jgi:hypothetical protein
MPPSSSAKKVAKVARSTSSRSRSGPQRRSLGFPLAVFLIAAAGLVLVGFGHNRRANATSVPPRLGDHWHAAYGVYVCDGFRAPLTDIGPDRLGVHTHDDGLIHIHPFSSAAAGQRSQLADFFDQVKLDVDDDKITFPGGEGAEVKKNGDTCPDGKAGTVKLFKWANVRNPDEKPVVITEDIADTRFEQDGEGYVIAFVPDGVEPPKPESLSALNNPVDVGPNSGFGEDGLPLDPEDTTGNTTAVDTSATTGAGEAPGTTAAPGTTGAPTTAAPGTTAAPTTTAATATTS